MKRIILVFFGLAAMTLTVNAAAAEIPRDVLAANKSGADVLHRDNRASRKSYINKQTSARRSVRDYSASEVPIEVVNRIRLDVSASHPHDFAKQLFYLHQQLNRFLQYGLVTSRALPPRVFECEDLE